MNFLEIDNYIIMNRSHYNESLLHNSELNTKYKTLSFLNETAAKENIEKVYTLYYYYINLYSDEKNQIWLYKEALLKEFTEMFITSL